MRHIVISVLAFVLTACPGNSNTPVIDAPGTHPDGSSHVDANTQGDGASGVDAAKLACTGNLYDACNPLASNCKAGTTCKTFNGSNFSVCTQTCGTCPMQNGQAVACNNMGVCKPSAPNSTCVAP
jgi:hypothetical protein